MEYKKLTEENLSEVAERYVAYYNTCENGCWTQEKARKRIHQVMTTEDAECLVGYQNGQIVGFAMGYYKQFDDLKGYFLEEIVIFNGFQNSGYGTELMNKLESVAKSNGAEHIELISVNDEHHAHFYGKLGYYSAKNLCMMGKRFN